MKNSTPVSIGLIAAAGSFGILGVLAGLAMFHRSIWIALLIGLIVMIVAGILIWIGNDSGSATTGSSSRTGTGGSASGTPPAGRAAAGPQGGDTGAVVAGDTAPDAAARDTGPITAGDGADNGRPAATPAAGDDDTGAITAGATAPDRTEEKSGAITAAAPGGSAAATPDFDGDGVQEGADEGTKPETLAAPRAGGADNLKEIKGVGPKLEKMLNEMGFWHFDQIANWTADEVAWVNANLTGFKGRVSRDNWVDQAKTLASGGETEFSRRVDKGEVY